MNKAFKGGSALSSSSSSCPPPPPLPPPLPPPPVAPLSPAPLSPWPTQTCEQIQVCVYVCVSVGEGTASNGFPGSVLAPLSCAGVSGQFTGMSAGPQGSQLWPASLPLALCQNKPWIICVWILHVPCCDVDTEVQSPCAGAPVLLSILNCSAQLCA